MQNRKLAFAILLAATHLVACNKTESKTQAPAPEAKRVVSGVDLNWPSEPSKLELPQKPGAEALSVRTEDKDTYVLMSLPADEKGTLDENCASFIQSLAGPLKVDPVSEKKEVEGIPTCNFKLTNNELATYGVMTIAGGKAYVAYTLFESSVDNPDKVKKAQDFVNSLKFKYSSPGK